MVSVHNQSLHLEKSSDSNYLSFYQFPDKLKESSPVVKVHIECYHNNTSSSVGSENGNPLTKYGELYTTFKQNFIFFRNEKVISYTDELEIPLTSWSDNTSWPSLEGLAIQVDKYI